jgi:hypothetical protein
VNICGLEFVFCILSGISVYVCRCVSEGVESYLAFLFMMKKFVTAWLVF